MWSTTTAYGRLQTQHSQVAWLHHGLWWLVQLHPTLAQRQPLFVGAISRAQHSSRSSALTFRSVTGFLAFFCWTNHRVVARLIVSIPLLCSFFQGNKKEGGILLFVILLNCPWHQGDCEFWSVFTYREMSGNRKGKDWTSHQEKQENTSPSLQQCSTVSEGTKAAAQWQPSSDLGNKPPTNHLSL